MSEHPAVAYLRNAHQRAEELAQAATPGPWKAEEHAEHGFRVGTADDGSWVAWTGEFDDEPESSRPDSVFIAANSPATLLARVAAERAILAEHPSKTVLVPPIPGTSLTGLPVSAPVCKACGGNVPTSMPHISPAYPCRTVRLLAAGWGWTE